MFGLVRSMLLANGDLDFGSVYTPKFGTQDYMEGNDGVSESFGGNNYLGGVFHGWEFGFSKSTSHVRCSQKSIKPSGNGGNVLGNPYDLGYDNGHPTSN